MIRFLSALTFCLLPNLAGAQPSGRDDFSSVQHFTLTNDNAMSVGVTNYGAIITSVVVPDRDGQLADVVLGYRHLKGYTNAVDKPYFGAVVGRYGNRIAGGTFTLQGETYNLAINNAPNHLHGGIIGFDKVIWDVVRSGDRQIELSYLAKDGEEGYPGNLRSTVTYRLTDDNELIVRYTAETDQATPVNLTQHSYFNLRGEGRGDILDHELRINADRYTPVDQTLIPTGELEPVAGTPFDFRTAKPIGRDIDQDNEQLTFGGGYDHNWVLNVAEASGGKPSDGKASGGQNRGGQNRGGQNPGGRGLDLHLAAEVHEPTTGRTLVVKTTEPGVQFYCGNFLDGRLTGKSGQPYVHRGGFCLETQHFPDSPNQSTFPSTILQPGETLRSETSFQFGVR